MTPARILILYNEPILPPGHPDFESEHDVLNTADAVAGFLEAAGFAVSRLGGGRNVDALLAGLREQRPDAVFNLFEGFADQGDTEAHVAGLLDWLGIPFTGCPAPALALAHRKHLSKFLFRGAGLPTPDFLVVDGPAVPACPIPWPVIVKPAQQDASVGLDQGSVVTAAVQLEDRVRHLLARYGPPVLVEEFIAGRELNVAVVEAPEARTLPVGEILFLDQGPGSWPIVTYDAKWRRDSRDFKATPAKYPADVDPGLAGRLKAFACRAFRLLGCRDYARVDFRVRPSGEPLLLEVNPNPDFNPTAGLAAGLAAAGLTHARFTADLVRAALARGSRA